MDNGVLCVSLGRSRAIWYVEFETFILLGAQPATYSGGRLRIGVR
jgi:hypothetical protein